MAEGQAPRTVAALLCTKLGSPSEPVGSPNAPLQLVQQPVAILPANGVRIRVAAAAVNFADALQIKGEYQVRREARGRPPGKRQGGTEQTGCAGLTGPATRPRPRPRRPPSPPTACPLQEKPKLPFVPGSEVSGTVLEAGRDVRTLAPGDRVCAVLPGGGFAEEAVARAPSVLKLPPGVDLEAAAGLPVAFGTAYLALRYRADLRPGQTLLVLGAGGGVGLAAVQLGKSMGARVVAVARGRPKMAALRAAGADECIDMEGRRWEQLPALVRPAASQGGTLPPPPLEAPSRGICPAPALLGAWTGCTRWLPRPTTLDGS